MISENIHIVNVNKVQCCTKIVELELKSRNFIQIFLCVLQQKESHADLIQKIFIFG